MMSFLLAVCLFCGIFIAFVCLSLWCWGLMWIWLYQFLSSLIYFVCYCFILRLALQWRSNVYFLFDQCLVSKIYLVLQCNFDAPDRISKRQNSLYYNPQYAKSILLQTWSASTIHCRACTLHKSCKPFRVPCNRRKSASQRMPIWLHAAFRIWYYIGLCDKIEFHLVIMNAIPGAKLSYLLNHYSPWDLQQLFQF